MAALGAALIVAWLVMYALLAAACVVIYRDARRRKASAELWLLATIVPGSVGLLLILAPFFLPAQAVWICAPFGVLLTMLGPIIYMLSWGHERGAGGIERPREGEGARGET